MEGEITGTDKISLLREFTARQAEVALDKVSWSWNPGAALFPEAQCPFCKATMISNRIWLVVDRQLLGRWKLAAGRLRKERTDGSNLHPHVNGTSICMGTGTRGSALTALFLGMYPEDSYWGSSDARWAAWLRTVFDHACPEVPPSPRCRHRCCQACCRDNNCNRVWS